MKCMATALPGVLVFEPERFSDSRGFFMELWHAKRYADFGLPEVFVQDNLSYSVKGTLRGLHYQNPWAQGKLVQVIRGEVYDVAVDIRRGSPTWGRWVGVTLSADNGRQLYIPEGFAHGFCVTSERALFSYKCTNSYVPQADGGIAWDDPDLAIDWPVKRPVVSEKDARHPRLRDMLPERLPLYGRRGAVGCPTIMQHWE